MRRTALFSPGRIVRLGLLIAFTFAALPGEVLGEQSTSPIDREFIRETVESLAAAVHREYFDPDVADRVDASLRQWLAQGRYADAQTLESLAVMLTRDLFATTHDKHLAVTVVQDTTST